jgi:hypothetical protein
MHLVYYDESGDDGYPVCASPLFVLSAVYCPALDWMENFEFITGSSSAFIRGYSYR